jgi:hypothetical protein
MAGSARGLADPRRDPRGGSGVSLGVPSRAVRASQRTFRRRPQAGPDEAAGHGGAPWPRFDPRRRLRWRRDVAPDGRPRRPADGCGRPAGHARGVRHGRRDGRRGGACDPRPLAADGARDRDRRCCGLRSRALQRGRRRSVRARAHAARSAARGPGDHGDAPARMDERSVGPLPRPGTPGGTHGHRCGRGVSVCRPRWIRRSRQRSATASASTAACGPPAPDMGDSSRCGGTSPRREVDPPVQTARASDMRFVHEYLPRPCSSARPRRTVADAESSRSRCTSNTASCSLSKTVGAKPP